MSVLRVKFEGIFSFGLWGCLVPNTPTLLVLDKNLHDVPHGDSPPTVRAHVLPKVDVLRVRVAHEPERLQGLRWLRE